MGTFDFPEPQKVISVLYTKYILLLHVIKIFFTEMKIFVICSDEME